MPAQIGASAELSLDVTDADTAVAHRSGSVAVLATPRVVALVEEACCAALAGQTEPGETSVGMRIQLDHLAPVKVGSQVRAVATVGRDRLSLEAELALERGDQASLAALTAALGESLDPGDLGAG